MVRTGTKTPEEVDGAKEAPVAETAATLLWLQKEDDCKIWIWRKNERQSDFQIINYRTGYQATQYKKTIDNLPVLWVNKTTKALMM